jgi:ABC-type oligopeptide transport system substrate-binding subunit
MKKHLFGSLLTASALLLAACGEAATSSSIVSSSVSSSVSTSAPAVPLAGFANGEFNFKFASTEIRNVFFGAAERWLLDTGAGGIPLFANAGFTMFSDRLQLFTELYNPVLGFGVAFSRMTADDSTVTVEGVKGKVGEFTFRGALVNNPTSFNQWTTNDSNSSDAGEIMLTSLYDFDFNADKTGYILSPELAGGEPIPVDGRTLDSGSSASTKWRIPIRAGLKWGFHSSVDPVSRGYDENITADDFLDTFKLALDQKWFRARTGGSHFWAATNKVKGAEEYFNKINAGEVGDWDAVGMKKVIVGGVEHLEFDFETELSTWNIKYWLSSNVMSPVHTGLFADVTTLYGTTPETTAYHGPYKLEYYETDKVIRYVRNPNYVFPTKYFYTAYNYQIIKDSIIRFNSFINGDLESGAVTATTFEQYKNDPRLRRIPGATTFRFGINALKTPEAQEEAFPAAENGDWAPEPILANRNMAKALYFAVDRRRLAIDVNKTSQIQQFHFTDAYLVDPESGVPFRQSKEAKLYEEGLSVETNGFNKAAATSFFKAAVTESINEGFYVRGTPNAPTVIEIQVIIQAASDTQLVMFQYLKQAYEETFVDDVNNVRVLLNPLFAVFPDNYYAHLLIGQFDIGVGGISGSALDAAGFLEVYASDNRGGFTFTWGYDTNIPEIEVTYTLGGNKVTEMWSFDAIEAALVGPAKIFNGAKVNE